MIGDTKFCSYLMVWSFSLGDIWKVTQAKVLEIHTRQEAEIKYQR